ncbi:hypothetical protein L1987_67061 [Smallanthus sonchifolius]|uniref:Uncharacterized protein n=1 Tax=Smallanthus sonchifolius TaxID=185202 RepID=A0ACB9BYX7_9ASTR|nr:hypothetical protein L1987_67061 [Smallanthus sonchifolius]
MVGFERENVKSQEAEAYMFIAGVRKMMNIANMGRSLVLLIFLLSGFFLPKTQISNWWEWAYWLSPLSYILKAITINEFLDSRWTSLRSFDNSTCLGFDVLKNMDIPTSESL